MSSSPPSELFLERLEASLAEPPGLSLETLTTNDNAHFMDLLSRQCPPLQVSGFQLNEESDRLFIEQDVKNRVSIVVRGLGMVGLAGSSTLSKPGVVLLALVIAMIIAIMVAFGTFSLMRSDNASVQAAVIRAAIAFAGTLTLLAVLAGTVHSMLT